MESLLEIQTPRLVLRPLADEHAPALHGVFGDPRAMQFWHTPPHRDLSDTRNVVHGLIRGPDRAWVLLPRGGGDAIGLVYYLGNGPAPGMGYILHPSHWGRGVMSEGVKGALDVGFDRLRLDRVELWIDSRNLRSLRLAERIGFRQRAAFCMKYAHDAQSHEKLVYGLRRSEWRPGADPARPEGVRIYGAAAVLPVPDVRGTAEFYRDRLGFRVAFLVGEPPVYGAVTLGEWTGTGVTIRLAGGAQPGACQGHSLVLHAGPGLDGLFQAYVGKGVDVVEAPTLRPWGDYDFSIRDCNGCVLRFLTPG